VGCFSHILAKKRVKVGRFCGKMTLSDKLLGDFSFAMRSGIFLKPAWSKDDYVFKYWEVPLCSQYKKPIIAGL
jgi:hypothetical protein